MKFKELLGILHEKYILSLNRYIDLSRMLKCLDFKNKKVLDIGCDLGNISIFASRKGASNVVGFDVNKEHLVKANMRRDKKTIFMIADATKMPLKSRTFDIIICSEVIEHVKDDSAIFSEIRRLLKKDGYCFITTPDFNTHKKMSRSIGKEKFLRRMDHVRFGYTLDELIRKGKENNLHPVKINFYANSVFEIKTTEISGKIPYPINYATSTFLGYFHILIDTFLKSNRNDQCISLHVLFKKV